MNALNFIIRDKVSLEDAVAAANNWALVARPIILATLRLDGIAEDELWTLRKLEPDQRRTYDEANGYIQTARRCLDEMLDGIRDDFLADQRLTCAKSDEEAEAFDEFNDELEENVVSIKALIKLVEREDYDAFIGGAR